MEQEIKKFLKTKIIGKNIKFFSQIDSTQLEAKNMAENGIENGTLVITDNQVRGIGTHGRRWYSENRKNISFTLILYPKCSANKIDTITIDIAKCMADVIEKKCGKKVDIKEPNDLVICGKKVGGILTQMVTYGEKIKYLLIGIGLNVNSTEFPNELKKIATSLKNEFGKEFSREEIIFEFCNNFEKYCIEKNII